jgi:hypothetical protein
MAHLWQGAISGDALVLLTGASVAGVLVLVRLWHMMRARQVRIAGTGPVSLFAKPSDESENALARMPSDPTARLAQDLPPRGVDEPLSASDPLMSAQATLPVGHDTRAVSPQGFLESARAHLANDDVVAATRDLRACVMLAAKLKDPLSAAAGRLELGDLAEADGDMTTACEHWQMARTAYSDWQRKAEVLAIEARMKQAGCPTDWVLNHF